MTKKCTVTYTRDNDGWWVATVNEIPGCHTQGRTIEQAKLRIREALSLWVKDISKVSLVDDIQLPKKIINLLDKVENQREQASCLQQDLHSNCRSTAVALTQELGLSYRDAGELLGLSRQRVQQMVKEEASTYRQTKNTK